MNRGEIREAVRDDLGEPREGFYKDAEINRWIQRAANRHAREALSVERTRLSTSIAGVQEYRFPPEFGQLIGVRFQLEGSDRWRRLVYIPKSKIAEWGYQETFPGTPRFYYVYDKGIGLFPVPNTAPLLEHTFPNECSRFVGRTSREQNTVIRESQVTLQIQPDTDDDPDGLCLAHIGYVSLHLRRFGPPLRGQLQLAVIRQSSDINQVYRFESSVIFAENVSTLPDWYHFDFADNPIEVTDTPENYRLILFTDQEYSENITRFLSTDIGIRVGAEPDNDVPYFQLHELRYDIEMDFWANTCRVMTLDTDVPEVREDYHDTLIVMTGALAARKGGRRNFQALALSLEAQAQGEINQARTNILQRTQGEKVNPDSIDDYDTTYMDYDEGSETFTLNFA